MCMNTQRTRQVHRSPIYSIIPGLYLTFFHLYTSLWKFQNFDVPATTTKITKSALLQSLQNPHFLFSGHSDRSNSLFHIFCSLFRELLQYFIFFLFRRGGWRFT